MPIITREEGSRPIKAWLGTKEVPTYGFEPGTADQAIEKVIDVEDAALQQTKNLARLPFIAPQGIALMPDAHLGKGATVGSVVPTIGAIIPSAVGVDLGCGMNAVRTSMKASDLPESLKAIRDAIEAAVPLGKGGNRDFDQETSLRSQEFGDLYTRAPQQVIYEVMGGHSAFVQKAGPQLGSLGSGNHFIEICTDENDDVWVMLHSGSRGIGNLIGSHYIEKAKKTMEQYFINLPDKDLAYIPDGTEDFKDYTEAVTWAQDYALANRAVMMDVVIAALRKHICKEFVLTSEAVNCHHNYISRENHFGQNVWVTRKGAIQARKDQLGIIPGSMGQKSYIVRGKGNPDSYCSCSHGAGRAMSRAEAKRRFSLTDLVAQTEGVECRKDVDVLDEIPGAYKRLDVVMELQKDLVEVVHTLKAVLCVKGN
jgi:tRNA-splicing ligase RtcB